MQLSRKLQRFRTCRQNKKCSIFHQLSEYQQKLATFSHWTDPLTLFSYLDTCANVSPVLWTLPQKLPNIREECVTNLRHRKATERNSMRIIVIPTIQDAGRTRFVRTDGTRVNSFVSVVQMLSDSMMEAVDVSLYSYIRKFSSHYRRCCV